MGRKITCARGRAKHKLHRTSPKFCFDKLRRQTCGCSTSLMTPSAAIIMHFSQYPFSLPCFLSLWYIVGLCLGNYLLPRKGLALGAVQRSGQVPGFQPV
jgi:hypothetical protein